MSESLKQAVIDLCAEQGAEPLLICVCGSRSFGYAAPHSDYDVRFIYAFPPARYFSLTPPPEELRVEGADAVGYELGKFLRIAHKNGWNALEMLASPLLYSHACVEELRVLCQAALRPERAAHSLRHCAHTYLRHLQHLPTAEQAREKACKLLLGALRVLLAASYVLQHRKMYPLLMAELVRATGTPELCDIVAQLAACRAQGLTPAPELLAAAGKYCEQLEAALPELPPIDDTTPDATAMEAFYMHVVTQFSPL